MTTRLRRRFRNLLVGLTSAAIVLAGAAYVAGPTRLTATMTVDQGEVAPAAYLAAPLAHVPTWCAWGAAGRQPEALYGRISGDYDGQTDTGVVSLGMAVGPWTVPCAQILVDPAGTYRWSGDLRPGRYRVRAVVQAGGRTATAVQPLTMATGQAYQVSIRVQAGGAFTFLPVSSY